MPHIRQGALDATAAEGREVVRNEENGSPTRVAGCRKSHPRAIVGAPSCPSLLPEWLVSAQTGGLEVAPPDDWARRPVGSRGIRLPCEAFGHRAGVQLRIGEAGGGSDCERNALPETVVGEQSLMSASVKTLFVTVEFEHGRISVVN